MKTGEYEMTWRHQWTRKGLQRGDFSALLELTNGSRWNDPDPACLQRLHERGFIKKREDKKPWVTTMGRVARYSAVIRGRRQVGERRAE